jgi:hypothetical protein
MIIAQRLCPDNAMHVRLHELLDKINLPEFANGRRSKNVQYGDDILMMKVPKQLDLSKRTERKHGVLEG